MPPLLELDGVTAGYGKITVLRDVSMVVPQGSVVAVVGPNGAGKTTTLRTIAGTLPVSRGEIRLGGEPIHRLAAYDRARRGVTLIPEGRGIFPKLDVRDNLAVAARRVPADQRDDAIESVLQTFPRLRERMAQRAGTLSGGEQQMLAMSRALLADARVLLLDEISMGLAPRIVAELYDSIELLRDRGATIVLVEQFLTYALRLADVCYVLNKGSIAFVGEPAELQSGDGVPGYLSA